MIQDAAYQFWGMEPPTHVIRVVYQSGRDNLSERKLRSFLRQAEQLEYTLSGAQNALMHYLSSTSAGNNLSLSSLYAVFNEGATLAVKHLDAQGDPDRLVCTISEVPRKS
jgi:hypothetical protein